MSTVGEIMNDDEKEDIYELMEEHRNLQCYICSGWATECPCEENKFDRETKKKMIELRFGKQNVSKHEHRYYKNSRQMSDTCIICGFLRQSVATNHVQPIRDGYTSL